MTPQCSRMTHMQVSVRACSHEACHQGSVRVRLKSPVPGCQDAEMVLQPPEAGRALPAALVPLPTETPAFVILEVCTVRASLGQKLVVLDGTEPLGGGLAPCLSPGHQDCSGNCLKPSSSRGSARACHLSAVVGIPAALPRWGAG